MYWSKVKTILIILFFCINIFLLVNIAVLINRSTIISDDTVNNTVEIMKKNNIEINKDIIPIKMSTLPVLEMHNFIYEPQDFAQAILGEDAKYVEDAEDGDVLQYTSEAKKLKIRGCKFSYIDNAPSQVITDFDKEKAEGYAKRILEEFKFNLKDIVIDSVKKQGNDNYFIVFRQRFSGMDIYGCYINMSVSKNGLISMEGYWLTPKKFTAKYPMRDITSVLIDFIKNDERPKDGIITITSINYVYVVDTQNYDIKTLSVVPVWRIVTQDGKEYFYDAINIFN